MMFTYILAAVFLLLLGHISYLRLWHALAPIPGPWLASVSRLWLVKHVWSADMTWTVTDLHKQHGLIVRTGPNEVSISDPTAIKLIYGAGSRFHKAEWYSVWQGRRKFDLFPERDPHVHASQRRLVSKIYSKSSLKDLEPFVNGCIELFLSKMKQQEKNVIDMGYWLQLFAFDVIGEITFSKNFGFMESGQDDGSFATILRATRSASWVGQIPILYWINDFFAPYLGNKLAIAHRHGSVRKFAVKEIAARLERGGDRSDILSSLEAIHQKRPTEFDRESVTSMATSNVFAGSDTTAISTRAIIYYLLKTPRCLHLLNEELDEGRRQGKISDPITLEQADGLPYLQAVIHEALRLHPVTGLTLPRVVPAGGATIAGTFLPGGTVVGTSPWLIQRNADVFGDDVDSFRPERWLQEDVADMHRLFFAFGSGARICIGKNISMMEMSKLVPTLLMRYRVRLAEPEKEWSLRCYWFVYQDGLNVRLTPRTL